MTAAVAYVRASAEHQNYSTGHQTSVLQTYAAERGLEIVRTYGDEGRSGLTLAGRPALRRLFADVLSPERDFKVLLVYDISRWGRFQDPDESAHYEFVCRQAGVRVVYCAEPFDNDGSAMANIMKHIKREMAGEFSRDLSKKVALGKARLAQLGFRQGGRRGYGFERLLIDKDGNPKIILEDGQRKYFQSDRVVCILGPEHEREVVRRIFKMFTVEGLPVARIAARLNIEGAPSPTGDSWSRGVVSFILADERYVGTLVYGRSTSRLKTGNRPVPSEHWIRVKGAIEPTVSTRTFARAQAITRTRRERLDDKRFLSGLRRVLDKHGTINQVLIGADKKIPCVTAYQRRFGTLFEAYRRIGFVPTKTIRGMPRSIYGTDTEILAKLRALLDAKGYLNRDLIRDTTDVPSVSWLQRQFGSITAIYKMLGYEPAKTWRGRPRSAS